MPYATPTALDRNLALEVVRVTEASALAASRWTGRGDERAADQAAAEAMRDCLNSLRMTGMVVNGEGDDIERPLHTGEKIGNGDGPRVEIALTPLEGATICAKGSHNALSVVAATDDGSFLHVPSGAYMEKVAVGGGLPQGILDLDAKTGDLLDRIAQAKGCHVAELTVAVLDRPRHGELLARIHEAGARVLLVDDGDVSCAIATGLPECGIDVYMGSGGAAQGVLAAAGLKCLDGQMQCRFMIRNEDDRNRLRHAQVEDWGRKLNIDDMVRGDVMFAATGITDGHLLRGVRHQPGGAVSHSLVMRSSTRTIRNLTARHDFAKRPQQIP